MLFLVWTKQRNFWQEAGASVVISTKSKGSLARIWSKSGQKLEFRTTGISTGWIDFNDEAAKYVNKKSRQFASPHPWGESELSTHSLLGCTASASNISIHTHPIRSGLDVLLSYPEHSLSTPWPLFLRLPISYRRLTTNNIWNWRA